MDTVYTLSTGNSPNGTVNIERSSCLSTLTAIPDLGYYFNNWSDGSTENPHTIAVFSDTTISAHFAMYSPDVTSNSENYCRGLKNPTSFTITDGPNLSNAQWYGYTGTKNDQASACGNWGMSFPDSNYVPADQLESFTSSVSSCISSNSVDIHGQSDYQRRFVIKGQGYDSLTHNRLSYLPPDPTFTSSIRLGNNCGGGGGQAEMLCYQFHVRPQNALVTIWYALSLLNGQHAAQFNPEFAIEVEKQTGSTWTRVGGDTLCYLVATPAGSGSNVYPFYVGSTGTHTGASYGCNLYLPWNKVVINLSKYLYETVRIKIASSDCRLSAHYACAYIAGECQSVEVASSGCTGTAIIDTLRAPKGLSDYTWYRSDIDGNLVPDLDDVNDTIPFVQLTNGTITHPDTNNVFLVDTSHLRVHLVASDGSDSIGLTDNIVIRCDVTSYMNIFPVTSRLYARVVNHMVDNFQLSSLDTLMGICQLTQTPICSNPIAIFEATPNAGYRFHQWNDGNTDNPRTLVVTSDTSIVGYFAYEFHDTVYIHDTIYVDPNGIEDVQTVEARIFQRDGQIVVELDEGSESLDVQVYDVVGRLLATRQGEDVHGGTPLRFDVPASGVYLVRIGDRAARKVVVVR